jgi:protein TonB
MKSSHAVFDYDREYGRDIRIASAVSLAAVIAVFLFAPQPQVPPYQFRGVSDWVVTPLDTAAFVVPPPARPKLEPRGVPVPSANPDVQTIGKNTSFGDSTTIPPTPELEPVPFWKVEHKPVIVHQVIPEYPELCRIAGIGGRVAVSVVVDTLGNVRSVEILKSSGSILLDQAAVTAAHGFRFVPGYQRDRPVPVTVSIPFNFELQ